MEDPDTFKMVAKAGAWIVPAMAAFAPDILDHPYYGNPALPAYAVFADDTGASHVWVLEPEAMTVHRRAVKTGQLTGTESIEVVDGLSAGEVIAVTGVARLREGMKVRDLATVEGFDR